MSNHRNLANRLKRQARKMKREARRAQRDIKKAQRKMKRASRKAESKLARLQREAKKVHLECTCGKKATYHINNIPDECSRCGAPVIWC